MCLTGRETLLLAKLMRIEGERPGLYRWILPMPSNHWFVLNYPAHRPTPSNPRAPGGLQRSRIRNSFGQTTNPILSPPAPAAAYAERPTAVAPARLSELQRFPNVPAEAGLLAEQAYPGTLRWTSCCTPCSAPWRWRRRSVTLLQAKEGGGE
jgi:hypothetical protein